MAELKRLGSRRVTRRIKTDGKKFDGEVLRFYYVRDCDPPTTVQIAVVVNKRHGMSTQRNLIKRRIREACRVLIDPHGEHVNGIPLSALVVYRGSKRQPDKRVLFTDIMNDVLALRREITSSTMST